MSAKQIEEKIKHKLESLENSLEYKGEKFSTIKKEVESEEEDSKQYSLIICYKKDESSKNKFRRLDFRDTIQLNANRESGLKKNERQTLNQT